MTDAWLFHQNYRYITIIIIARRHNSGAAHHHHYHCQDHDDNDNDGDDVDRGSSNQWVQIGTIPGDKCPRNTLQRS